MPGAAPRVVIAQSVTALAAFAVAAAVLVQPAQAKRAGAPAWSLALAGPAKASYVSAASFGAWQAAGIRLIVTTRSTWRSADHARLARLAARYGLRLVEPVTAPKTAAARAALRKACATPRARIDSCAVAAAGPAAWSAWRKLGNVDFVVVHVASPRAVAGFARPLPGGTRLIALSPLPSAGSKNAWTSAAALSSSSSVVLGASVGAQSASAGLGVYLQVARAAGGQTKTTAGVNAPDTTPPSIPSGLVSQAVTATSATVAWSPATDAVGVTSYTVSLSSSPYGTTADTSYTVNGLACSTSYTVGVTASDAAGNTSLEATLVVKTSACAGGGGGGGGGGSGDAQAPSVPTGLGSVTAATSATLTWGASTDNVSVAGYAVYRDGALIGATPTTNFPVSGLQCGTTYTLAVDAYDAAGNHSAKATLLATTNACTDTQAPSTPTGLASTAKTATTVTLTWSAATDNVAVTGYTLYKAGTAAGTTATTGYTATGLTCGTSYSFSADAYDAAGNHSAKSSSITATTSACTDTQAPSVPGALTQTAATATSITLSWAASTDNVGVAGYGLYQNGVGVSQTSSTSAVFAGLQCGTTYTLAVDAYDAAGNHSAKTTQLATTNACTDTQAPSTPTGLASTAKTATTVTLTWSAATDNVAVTGYTLYKAGTAAGTTATTGYTATGLTCGTSYSFSADAYDAAGNHSAKSSSITATTSACTDTQAPSVPASLASPSTSITSVSLTWASSTDNVGVAGYTVYQSGSTAGTTASAGYTVSGLTCATTYSFSVDAYDAAGNHSAQSSTVSATTAACPVAGSANVWVDPSGGTCTRQSSAGAWVDAQGCSSIQAAVAACVPGDVVMVKSGSYGSQTITTSKTAPGCTVDAEAGTSIGALSTQGNWLTLENLAVTGGWDTADVGPGLPNNVTLRNVAISGRVFLDGGNNISVIGGSACCTTSSGAPGGVMLQGDPNLLSNVVFDGVDFRDHQKSEPSSDHYEVIRIQDNVSGVTVRNSTFEHNSVDSATIFVSHTSAGVPSNLTIENNFFQDPQLNPFGIANPAYVTLDANLAGNACTNWVFDYNTFLGTPMGSFNACPATNVVWRANIAPKSAGTCVGTTFSHNLWVAGSSVDCGGTDTTVASAGLTGDGFHLSGTSPARGAGDPAACPATDHDGAARPSPVGSTCDAGADETN